VTRTPAARGFTLIELMVGLAIGAVLVTAATGVLVVARTSATEAALRAQMSRDAQLALDTIQRDLGYLGAGVPKDTNLDVIFNTTPPSGTSASGDSLLPVVRIAAPRNLVFLGDLPYPNAEVPGIASITHVRDQNSLVGAGRVALTNEVSGACSPPRTAAAFPFQCDTTTTTLIPGTYGPADKCDESQPTARTCPWAMNKWQPGPQGVFLTFVTTNGHWYERRLNAADIGSPFNEYIGIDLDNDFPAAGKGKVIADEFFNPVGAGYVTTIDRVFYAVEDPTQPLGTDCASPTNIDVGCGIYRLQCWGRLEDPEHADFPETAAAAVGSFGRSRSLLNCTAPDYGTGWEQLTTGVESFTFTYFRTNSAVINPVDDDVDRGNVRAIQVAMTLSRKIPGSVGPRRVQHHARRVFFLNNRVGL
jgi:prepilin-type N-terminal cleavage/methylation domain-containing protein